MDAKQGLALAQELKLSPSLLQSMGILQMTTLELADHLRDLALENPVLEETGGDESWERFAAQVPWLSDAPLPSGGEGAVEPGREDRETGSLSFLLEEQLARQGLDAPLLAVCRYLIDLLDERGWLAPEELADLAARGVPQALLDAGVAALQALDPPGIGARDLAECLRLQLQRQPDPPALALALCEEDRLAALAAGRYAALARTLGTTAAAVEAAADVLRALDPAPGREDPPGEPVAYVRPDAWVAEIDGTLQVFVNQWDLPQFRVSEAYRAMAQDAPEEETAVYLRAKLQQARWVLQCVHRRQETLYACLTALVRAQEGFFRGDWAAPRPLLRQTLAEELGVHPSTVTRALRHKYLQCRQGLYPTSWFFGRAVGPAQVGGQELRAALLRLIRDEERPLSDQALAERLAAEGLPVARRTVAKHRAALGIPTAGQRRRGR